MNDFERAMVDMLKELKEEYGVIQIKAEYENEGSRHDELSRLKDITSAVGLPILIKIGGVEAVSDIYTALIVGVSGLVAPMAETKFAVSKFTNTVEKLIARDNIGDIEFAINVETITACENFHDMLTLQNIKVLSGITIGRVDLAASLGKDRTFVDTPDMMKLCEDTFVKARAAGLGCGLGGGISKDSVDFLGALISKDLIDFFETRKVVFDRSGIKTFESGGIDVALQFELLWLKSKQRYYHNIKFEDHTRIKMLEARLGESS